MTTKPLKKIIITGTHLTPATELIRQLHQDNLTNWDIYYIGRNFNSNVKPESSIESQIIPQLQVKFFGISCGKFDRRWFPNTLRGIPQTFKGFFEAAKLVRQIKPDIVISFGGYVSVPVIIDSWLKHIPSITHEQTITNSLTTKINGLFVNKVALSFNHHLSKKTVITGNLLRSEIFNSQSKPLQNLGPNTHQFPLIYITAGNQGSHKINLLIKDLLPSMKNFIIIHQTGRNDHHDFSQLNQKYPNYHAFDYINSSHIGWVFHHTNLIISRAGANTCQEIVALHQKSILIPLIKSQQNEQKLNAAWVKQNQPQKTLILSETKITPKILLKSIKKLLLQKNQIAPSFHSQNLKILQLIHELV